MTSTIPTMDILSKVAETGRAAYDLVMMSPGALGVLVHAGLRDTCDVRTIANDALRDRVTVEGLSRMPLPVVRGSVSQFPYFW